MVGVFVAKTKDGVRVAVTGAGPAVFRVKAMEDALAKNFTSAAIKDIKIPSGDLNSDIHGSAEYRAHLVGVMARRAVDTSIASGHWQLTRAARVRYACAGALMKGD